MAEKSRYYVQQVRHLTDSVFLIKIDRHDFNLKAGQHVTLGIKGAAINREYSAYSSPDDSYLEFLIKAYPDSETAHLLQQAEPGTEVDLAGPYGKFSIPDNLAPDTPIVFIASGVGIAPFNSFIKTFPNLNYKIIHGIPYAEDRYEYKQYPADRYIACLSKENADDCFSGRVTDYLKQNPVSPESCCFICGNNLMIAEAYDILREQGVSSNQLHTEVFF